MKRFEYKAVDIGKDDTLYQGASYADRLSTYLSDRSRDGWSLSGVCGTTMIFKRMKVDPIPSGLLCQKPSGFAKFMKWLLR